MYSMLRAATAIAIVMGVGGQAYGAAGQAGASGPGPARDPAPIPVADFPPRQRINPTKRTLRFVVPLTDGPTYLGDVDLAVSPLDELSVAAPRLLQLLEPLLRADAYARIVQAAGSAGEIGAPILAKEGIILVYDGDRLALSIIIPVAVRGMRSISLRGPTGQTQPNLTPALFSGYLNLRSSTDIIYQGAGAGVQAPVAAIDGAVRIAGVVAEGEAYASARRGDVPFRRAGSRIVIDDADRAIRWTGGDLRPAVRSFHGAPAMAGLSVARLYDQLEPQREIRATGSRTFTILAPSTVETIVNGRSVERRRVQPGTYSLADFPLADGANDVRLLIEDEAGDRHSIDFSLFSDRSLLQPGLSEFSASVGALSQPTRAGLAYSSTIVASGFWRRGLSPQLTAGVNMQGDGRTQQAGAEVLFGSPLGLIGLDVAGSRARGRPAGIAIAVSYQLLKQSSASFQSQSLRAAVEYRSAHFTDPGNFTLTPARSVQASLSYNRTLGPDRYIGADVRYSRSANQPADLSIRSLFGLHLSESTRFIGETEYRRFNGRREAIARMGIVRRFGTRAQARVEADTRGGARASYQALGGQGVGAWSLSADVNRTPDGTTVNTGGTYIANRAELGVSHIAAFADGGGRDVDQRTSLRVGTSIAFADGAFAVGRPITNSFLIARPHRSLKGKSVRLEPQKRGETARSGALGPALAPDLSAYSDRIMTYDVPDAPAGYDLGQGNAQVKPPNRAGYRLEIGSDYHLLVFGRLLDAEGEAVSLLAGKATDLANPKRPPMTIFTGRNGKFGAQGMRPGKWRIEMPTVPPTYFEIMVGQSDNDVVQLGDVHALASTQGEK